jgi:L-ribulose-5-phosphate 3-epimerase
LIERTLNISIPQPRFGISQGRLTQSNELQRFPSEAWQVEFREAQKLGFNFIELLTERKFNVENPVWNPAGRKEIKRLCKSKSFGIYSICLDYIIDHSLLDDPSKTTFRHVEDVFAVAGDLGCKVVLFPLLEKSNLQKDNLDQFIPIFRDLSVKASLYNFTICVESLLDSNKLLDFLEGVNKENVKAVFDTGNRVIQADCSDLHGEILSLGKYIKHVHVKDKNKYGENVILGTGLVDFRSVFSALNKINYDGPLNFETTRGSNPLKTAAFHMSLCNFFINEVSE